MAHFVNYEAWLLGVGKGSVLSLNRTVFASAFAALEIFLTEDNISAEVRSSLEGYTWKKRQFGLVAVVGSDKLNQFFEFVDRCVEKYGDLIQPTESGSLKVGMRRLLFDSVCYGAGCMDSEMFFDHVSAAATNGLLYASGERSGMLVVLSPVDGEKHLPASFPPAYPAELAEFLSGWL